MAAVKEKKTKKPAKTVKSKNSDHMRAEDLRGKSPDELKDLVLGYKREQFNARFQKLAGEQPKASRSKAIRKNIARIKTIMNQSKVEAKNA